MRKTECILRKILTISPKHHDHIRVLEGKYEGRLGIVIAHTVLTNGWGIRSAGELLVLLFPTKKYSLEEIFFKPGELEVMEESTWKEWK